MGLKGGGQCTIIINSTNEAASRIWKSTKAHARELGGAATTRHGVLHSTAGWHRTSKLAHLISTHVPQPPMGRFASALVFEMPTRAKLRGRNME